MSAQKTKLLVTIDDKVYDLTAFKEHHPGGSEILEQYHEKDASDIFRAFHGAEGHAKLANMTGIPIRNPTPAPQRINDFRKLRQQLIDDGYFRPNPVYQTLKVLSTVGLVVAGIAVLNYNPSLWLLGAILVGVGYQQLGWLGHDACHHGLTPWRKVNNFMGYIFGNFLNGFSVNWWKNRHNTHHAITNVLDSDPDIDNLPLFVWSRFDLPKLSAPDCRGGTMASSIIPYQHLYFIPWTVTLKFIWCFQTVNFLLSPEYQNRSFRKVLTMERATIIAHYLLVLYMLYLTPSILAAIGFFFVSEFIGGSGIALIVFMNHYACEHFKKEDGKEADFLQLQLLTTKNINPGLFMDWFAGGLNYQIEHHLFPTIPRHNLCKVKPIVEQFCKKHNLPYVSQTYKECLTAVELRLAHIAETYVQSKP